jgi:hypothetical protein
MILELSLSLMSPSLWAFFIGWKNVGGADDILEADTFIVKCLFVMLQLTLYRINDTEDE